MHKKTYADKEAYVDSLTQWLTESTQGTGGLFESFTPRLGEDIIAKGKSPVISCRRFTAWFQPLHADLFVLELLGRAEFSAVSGEIVPRAAPDRRG